MKKFNYFKKGLAILLIVLILVSAFKFLIFKPKPVFADSTVGFNEGYGTTVNDNNGNISGTITNAVWKNEELCKNSKCLYFDGTGDYVSFGDDADLDYIAADNFTIEGWFRTPDITSGTRVLAAKYNSATSTDGGYKVYMDSSGYLVFGIDDDQTSFPEDSASTSTKTFDDNKWHHFAAVKTGTTSITIYVDGIQYQTDSSISSTGTLANTDAYYVGIDGDGSSNGFSGFLDEVSIRTGARTSAEVKTDMVSVESATAVFGPHQSHLSDGLVGYWRSDETAANSCTGGANDACDSSGNSLDAAAAGNPTYSPVGKFGYTMSFDGTGDSLAVSDNDVFSIDTTNQLTASAWVYPNNVTGTQYFLSKGTTSNYEWAIYSNADSLQVSIWTSSGGSQLAFANATTTVQASVWQHIAFTADLSKNELFVYKNGIRVASVTSFSNTYTNGTAAFRIGERADGSGDVNGKIDETRIYNRALPQPEIMQLYKYAPAPVGNWRLDENTGTTANDTSGLDNSLTLTNTPKWSTGKFGSAITFAGSNQQLLRADDSDFDFGVGASFSFGAWIKHNTASAQEVIIAKNDTAIGAGGYKLYMESDGDLTCGIDDDGTLFPGDSATSTLATYDDNNWHYVSCVKNESSGLYLYIDGVLIASDTSITATSDIANSDPLYIGIAEDGTSNDWIGQIDDIHIYNYARTAEQIIEEMNGDHPAPGSPVGSSVAYWKMDEGFGTSANDGSVNGNTLTLSAASWNNNGKFGRAFNGLTNVRLSRADDADFDFTGSEDATFSLWFKSDSATNPSANEYLLEKGGNITTDAVGYAIYTSAASDGLICFGIDDDATSFPEDSVCSTSDLYDNTWHHIVATKTGTTRLDLYVDGKANGTPDTSISATGTLANASSFYLGDTNATDGTDEFLGDLDEVKIFRSALSDDAVKVLYNQNAGASMGGASTNSSNGPSNSLNDAYCPPGQGSTCTAPFAHYDFDANSGTPTTIYDKSGNNYDGTVSGSMTTENWVSGAYGSGLKFDGSNDLVNIYSAGLNTSFDETVGTISVWLKLSPTDWADTSDTRAAVQLAADTNNFVVIRKSTSANTLAMVYSGAATSDSHNYTSTRNDWFNVTIVWDKPNEYFDVYVDGVLIDHNTALGVWAGAIGSTRANIGARLSDGTNPFMGQIDDVQIYNYARTPAQVAWGYNKGKPTSWYRFDENTGSPTTLSDATISRNDGTASGTMDSSDWLSGKFNSSLDFDGTDDAITVANADPIDLNINLFAGFTFAAWVYPNSDGENDAGRIFQKGSNGSTTDSSNTFCRTSGESAGRVDITCSVNLDTTETNFTVTSAIPINTWSHVAFSWNNDADDEVTVWINGVPSTSTAFFSGDPAADTADLYIAGNGTAASNTRAFDGQIDDFRIYNYEVNATQIKSIMLNSAAVKY